MKGLGSIGIMCMVWFGGMAHGGEKVDVVNGEFDEGLTGWTLSPGHKENVAVSACEGSVGPAVRLQAEGANLGLNSAPLKLGEALDRSATYRVSARFRFEGLSSGIAAFTLCAYDASDRRLVQYAVQHWSPGSKPHAWRACQALFGAGTSKPFPEKAVAIRFRISFYEARGNCKGALWTDGFQVERVETPKLSGWPASILVDCGDVQVRFESRSFWTLYRIDYKGVRLCKDQFGSHYGSVASFKGTGFIGSGHTENGETEQIDELQLKVDGKAVEKPAKEIRADRVTLLKTSRLRDLRLTTKVTVADNRILEEIRLQAVKPVALNLLYHAMHPWVVAMNRYLAVKTDGTRIEGEFVNDKGMRVAAPVRWSAVYSDTLGMGAVTVVLEVPEGLPWDTRYWDVPKRYHKHYLRTFADAVVPVGQTFTYRILTIPFQASAAAWQDTAAGLAASASAAP